MRRSQIIWFIDGKVVARASGGTAVPGVPMTLRVTMAGNGQEPMNQTRVMLDWVRGYPESTGRRAKGGARLTPVSSVPAC